MMRRIAGLTLALTLAAMLVVAPGPQISPGGEVSIGHAAAEASHQPCRPSYTTRWRPPNWGNAVNTRMVLTGDSVRPGAGGAWVNCHYRRLLWGYLPYGTFTRTVPHR